jgi:RNA polymerase sigma-70 factor (ECF subfamily)
MYATATENPFAAIAAALNVGFVTSRPDLAADDAALMGRYGRGDADAFRMLYGRYHQRLHRYLLRLAPGVADAEEVFQDVWAAVIRGRHDYRAETSFASWLFAIAHRRAADRWRTLDRHAPDWRSSGDDEAAYGDVAAAALSTPDRVVLSEALGKALIHAIDGLPLVQRDAFLLKAEGELTLEQIAAVTGTSRETVKSRLRYAQARLRAALEEWQ